jgi:hypothetical protein
MKVRRTTRSMTDETKAPGAGKRLPSSTYVRRNACASAVVLIMIRAIMQVIVPAVVLSQAIIAPTRACAQTPPRFYWKSLAGSNGVPAIFQSTNGNANPVDPARVVSVDGDISANILLVGYAKMLPVFGRTVTIALVEPVGTLSGKSTVQGQTFDQSTTGYGDPMLEMGINLVGPKAIMNIPDMLRYEPKLSIDLVGDIAFPIGQYDNSQPLNLGQNRWYGRVAAPMVLQIGPWVPGRRTTVEAVPAGWFFTDNNDYVDGRTLSTSAMFHLEGHVTRDVTDQFWASLDGVWMAGAKSSVDDAQGKALNSLFVGFTLGYQINDNLALTGAYMATVNDNEPTDLRMGGFRASLTYGWHSIIEGQKRLKSAE